MRKITVCDNNYFCCNNSPFFYAADTVWSAFAGPSLEEWDEYLRYRSLQGFNAVQISILPLWDRGNFSPFEPQKLLPFAVKKDGKYDFDCINEAYFERAKAFVECAVARGLVPVLNVLWCDYVPGTWGAAKRDFDVMPRDCALKYAEYAVRNFAPFTPIFVLGGDTDVKGEAVEIYLDTAKLIRKHSPDSLISIHLCGENSDLPDSVAKEIDFYMYQSGHIVRENNYSISLAKSFSEKEPPRPIINSEPCYEGHNRADGFGRYTAFDVRKAFWQSVLSGAKAGITYGAQGLWGFGRYGEDGNSIEFAGRPYDWHDAVRKEGAWQMGSLRHIWEKYELYKMVPYEKDIVAPRESCLAYNKDTKDFVLYLPYADRVIIPEEFESCKLTVVDLKNGRFLYPDCIQTAEGKKLPMQDIAEDMLIIGSAG